MVCRIPLDVFDTDLPGTEFWDLYLRIENGSTLRLGGFLDDVVDKKSALVFPARDVPALSGSRSVRPYFTVNNGLSVRSAPVQASAAPAPATPPPAKKVVPARRTRVRVRLHRLVRRIALRLARAVILRLPSRRPIPAVVGGRLRVSILVMHAYGMGGTIRTVFNQAAYLSRDHDVEIISQVRERTEPFFAVPPGVTLAPLDDRTEAGRPTWPLRVIRDRLARRPSLLVHPADPTFARCTLWTDVQLVRRLRAQRGGVLMATRASLNVLMAQLAAPEVITVGQVHLQYSGHAAALLKDLPNHYRHLDALTTLTRSDEEAWSAALAGSSTHLVQIPNSITPMTGGLSDPSSRVVVTVGRLTGGKRYDLAIRAFEEVVRAHPDWTLRIYGSGQQSQRLRQMVLDRRLYNNVLLMGRAERVGEELAKGSIFVLSSRSEGFPMVVLEAMSKGLAVVSTDCGGPSEIIDSGKDGLLVPNGDADALAQALLGLVEREDERRRLGEGALQKAAQYDAAVVGRSWDRLFAHLLAERSPSWWSTAAGADDQPNARG